MTNVGICLAEAKRYPAFTVFPFYHESGCMPWAAAVTIHMDNVKDIIFWWAYPVFLEEVSTPAMCGNAHRLVPG